MVSGHAPFHVPGLLVAIPTCERTAELLVAALAALREIANAAPEDEPQSDYDDTEGAESFGLNYGYWEQALVARAALKGLGADR